MKKLLIGLIVLSCSGFSTAHHSRANFDSEKTVVLNGTIVDFSWRNPHVFVEISADDTNGNNQTWLVEAHSVTSMQRNGWNRESLKVGEPVKLTGSPDRDPSKYFVLMNSIEKSDGTKLYAFRNPEAAPVQKVVEPSADFSGTWNLDMSRFNTRLAGGGPPEWNYTEAGQALVNDFSVNQNPELNCLAIGVPRISIYPYGTNFKRSENSLEIQKEHLNEERIAWFDRNAEALKNQEPSYVGLSYGQLKSPKHLIIESWNFLPTKWGNANGVDSSSEKTVVEEYILSEDGMSIEIKITITDPVYMNSPVIVTGGYLKDESREFAKVPCDPRAASRHLDVE